MSQLDKWMVGGKISKLVIVITDKDTGDHVERWQFDVSSYSIRPISVERLVYSQFKIIGPNLSARQVKIQVQVFLHNARRARKRCRCWRPSYS